MSRSTPGARAAWVLWWLVWSAFALPWSSMQFTPQWQRVEWLPFQVTRPRDWALNALFFVPFGALLAGGGMELVKIVAVTTLVAAGVESIQLFSSSRFPTSSDVVMNVVGALVGALWVIAPEQRRPAK